MLESHEFLLVGVPGDPGDPVFGELPFKDDGFSEEPLLERPVDCGIGCGELGGASFDSSFSFPTGFEVICGPCESLLGAEAFVPLEFRDA